MKGKISGKRCDVSSQNQASSLLIPQSYPSNVPTGAGAAIASPAKKRKRNQRNHFRRRRVSNAGKHRWAVGGSKWVHKQSSSGHSAAVPQPQRPTVQYHTDEGLDTPAQHIPRVREQDISSCQWLRNGAHIGNETRNIEFKLGRGNYMEKNFSKQVLKYGCAFLNSGGGSLLVGVQDNGVVCGVFFDHKKEDQTRLQVDEKIKQFNPPLFPHNYSLRFLPVRTPGEREHHLKVLCLTFRAPSAFAEPTLYQVGKGQVYMRRDGSVQGPLGVSVILEWSRQMWAGKVKQLEQHVCEATSEKWFLAGQLHTLRQTIGPLQQIAASLTQSASARRRKRHRRSSLRRNRRSNLTSQRSSASCENSRSQASSQLDLALVSTPPPELSHT
ncbi:schlafen-like protein 1 [Perca fluviatilis]|uniref:schlafen-like protein 1 n=1 Tax=Perca fluviatilis TaxID=8168 RepID=UPI0019661456|nr:schlafen-like protein 1 [Perca fluviatilis]